jgi:integrase
LVKSRRSRTRVPKLRFTTWRDIGWHVSYRDPDTRTPRKHCFNIRERNREADAKVLYHAWVVEHLGGQNPNGEPTHAKPPAKAKANNRPDLLSGCLLEIGSALIDAERSRSRTGDEPRRRGTIAAPVFRDRKKQIHDFLAFLNTRHGPGAVARMRLADLAMEDVEAYNQHIVAAGFSASEVGKRIQLVKAIIHRSGRPEHGKQVLAWNWDSRDVAHGKPAAERVLPTRGQLVRLLRGADLRGRTMIWLGIGLGFGARDLAAIRVGQITRDAYDLRRSKTGIERYGQTPPRVWRYVSLYQQRKKRPPGEFLFRTRTGMPLVHPKSNAVTLWWDRLRARIGRANETLPGFYTLRHLGATEFGSRPGTSIGDVKRWLGHSASSDMADVYMRPVRPEYREVIEWVRARLALPRLDETPPARKTRS